MNHTEIPSMNAARWTPKATPGMNAVIALATMNVTQSTSDTFHLTIFMPMYAYMMALKPMVGSNVNSMDMAARGYAKVMSMGAGRISHKAIELQNQWNKFA